MNKTQTAEILRYLRNHKKGITSKQAFEMFGATRLSAIIFRFRQRGYDIETLDETAKDRYGNTCTFARYVLHES